MITPTAILLLVLCHSIDNARAFSTPAQISLGHRALVSNPMNVQMKSNSGSLKMTTAATKGDASSQSDDPMFEGLGKGISKDFSARLPFYKSDITDGLNSQCLAATLFLFFACLAPAVGFGGLFFHCH